MLAQFVGVPLASFDGSQNSSGDDFAIYFQLADVLKRSTSQVVCLAYNGHIRWIEGQILERRIRIRHDVLLLNWQVQALGCDKKSPAMSRAFLL